MVFGPCCAHLGEEVEPLGGGEVTVHLGVDHFVSVEKPERRHQCAVEDEGDRLAAPRAGEPEVFAVPGLRCPDEALATVPLGMVPELNGGVVGEVHDAPRAGARLRSLG